MTMPSLAVPRDRGAVGMPRLLGRAALAVAIGAYTLYTLGPFLWLATMSVRTTGEISANHYAWPSPFHWEQYRTAWIDLNFATYFRNSTFVVVGAVAAVTLIGAAAAHRACALSLPRQSPDLRRPVLLDYLPAADHLDLALPNTRRI